MPGTIKEETPQMLGGSSGRARFRTESRARLQRAHQGTRLQGI